MNLQLLDLDHYVELKSVLLEIDHSYLYGTMKEFIYEQYDSGKINYNKIFTELKEDASEQNFSRFYINFVNFNYYIDVMSLI